MKEKPDCSKYECCPANNATSSFYDTECKSCRYLNATVIKQLQASQARIRELEEDKQTIIDTAKKVLTCWNEFDVVNESFIERILRDLKPFQDPYFKDLDTATIAEQEVKRIVEE